MRPMYIAGLLALCCVSVCTARVTEDFKGIRSSATVEVKSITAAAGITLRLTASQLASDPTSIQTSVPLETLDSSLTSQTSFQTEVNAILAYYPLCSLPKPVAYSTTTKIAAPFDIVCTSPVEDRPVASVSFSQSGAGTLAGVCVNVPTTMQLLPTTKITVSAKAPGVYTSVYTVVVPGLIDVTATFKWPYMTTVASIVDPTKATAYFTGAIPATGGAAGSIADTLGDTFNSLLPSSDYVLINSMLSSSPCIVTGTRSMPPVYSMAEFNGYVASFKWNGVFATNVYLSLDPFGLYEGGMGPGPSPAPSPSPAPAPAPAPGPGPGPAPGPTRH